MPSYSQAFQGSKPMTASPNTTIIVNRVQHLASLSAASVALLKNRYTVVHDVLVQTRS